MIDAFPVSFCSGSEREAGVAVFSRVLMAGGGTGGHIFPAVSIAREIVETAPSVNILFVGREGGMEARIIPETGFGFRSFEVRPLAGRSPLALLRGLFRVPLAIRDSMRIIGQFQPEIIIGTGSYVSGPVVTAGILKGIPTLIQEQNIYPGWTNRLLSPFVDGVAVTFEETATFLRGKCEVTGNPVRAEFFETSDQRDPVRFQLLVLGGSQGSRAINRAIVDELEKFRSLKGFAIKHQTGVKDFEWVSEAYGKVALEAEIVPFIDDVAGALEKADLVISRAGATTVSEINAVGRAALFVPFPHAAHDHQRKNAKALEKHGAAIVIEEKEIVPGLISATVAELAGDRRKIQLMAQRSAGFGRPDAAAKIVKMAANILSKRSKGKSC